MRVKELIIELLDCNLDANFDIDIKTDEEDMNTSEFEKHTENNYVTIIMNLKDQVLVDKKEYEKMVERLEELENEQ